MEGAWRARGGRMEGGSPSVLVEKGAWRAHGERVKKRVERARGGGMWEGACGERDSAWRARGGRSAWRESA